MAKREGEHTRTASEDHPRSYFWTLEGGFHGLMPPFSLNWKAFCACGIAHSPLGWEVSLACESCPVSQLYIQEMVSLGVLHMNEAAAYRSAVYKWGEGTYLSSTCEQ